MKLIRNYLISDEQLMVLLNNKEAIFLVEKPEQLNYDPYIVYFYKIIDGGVVKNYQLEFRLISKDLSKLLTIQSRLIKLLDTPYYNRIVKDDGYFVRLIKLLNGGGMLKNPATNNYEIILYFQVRF